MRQKVEYQHGYVYDFGDVAVYTFGDDDIERARRAFEISKDTPGDCTRLESDNDDLRDAFERATLLAELHDRITDFKFTRDDVSGTQHARIPAQIAAEGKAACAAYLAIHRLDNDEIAYWLNVSPRTVSQYITDFKQGDR